MSSTCITVSQRYAMSRRTRKIQDAATLCEPPPLQTCSQLHLPSHQHNNALRRRLHHVLLNFLLVFVWVFGVESRNACACKNALATPIDIKQQSSGNELTPFERISQSVHNGRVPAKRSSRPSCANGALPDFVFTLLP